MNVLQHRHKAVELALVEAGYSLAEIRGEREVHHVEEQPQGLVAAAGRVSPRSVRVAMACTLALGGLLAYETGVLSAVVLSVALAAGLHFLGEMDAEATEVRHEVQREGMPRQEVLDRLIQWNEWQEMKEEAAEPDHTPSAAQAGAPGRRH